MIATRERLALVVADTGTDAPVAAAALRAAHAQLDHEDALAWVSDRQPSDIAQTAADWRPVLGGLSRGELYGVGLEWACATGCDAVAFTDSGTSLEPHWRTAVSHAFAAGADVVGGPVVPGSIDGSHARSARSWAGFLTEYAPHAVPPYRSATGDLSANNVGYRVAVVASRCGREFWKTEVDRELRDDGRRLEVEPDMVACSLRGYSWHDLVVARGRAGRLYGSQVASGWSARRRWIRVGATVALPAVRVARLARDVRRDETLRRALRRSIHAVVVAELAWSAGEATGYALPRRPPSGVR